MIFIPLLTLSADMMHKFEDYNPTWGNVGVYHLGELYDCNRKLYSSLLRGCASIGRDTSPTFSVFLSPQFLINHRDALDVFVACAQERTLCVIAMDEAHIHVQHGTSFHDDICALRVDFSQRVLCNQPREIRLRLIALTATFLSSYVQLLSALLTVDLPIGDCVLRGRPEDCRHCEIEMKIEICLKKAQFVAKGLTVVAAFFQTNPDSSVVVFCNSRKQSQHFSQQLEKKLDQLRLAIDVVNINGSLDKIDKFWRIRLFCDDQHTCQGRFWALVTANALNVGIDKHCCWHPEYQRIS